jgi:DNA modification methylase
MDLYLNKVIEGDCLKVMQHLPPKSIDMILCDLPYGVTHNRWDAVIDLEKLWVLYKYIIKDNGAIVLTAQGVFTAQLILSNLEWFRYKMVWIKSKATNFLNVRKQPLRKHEDICVFYKKQPTYNLQMGEGKPYDRGIRTGNTDSYRNFKPAHIKSSGGRYPHDVLFYEEEQTDDAVYVKSPQQEGHYHATQKPVELGRYLVRKYTKPGEIVLDNACGSGSFLVSAILETRQFFGIEKNEYFLKHKEYKSDYIRICNERISQAIEQKRSLPDSLFP